MQEHHPKTQAEAISDYLSIVARAWKRRYRQRLAAIATAGISGFLLIFLVMLFIEKQAFLSPLLKSSLWLLALLTAFLGGYLLLRQLPKENKTEFIRRLTNETELYPLRYLMDLNSQQQAQKSGLTDAAIRQNIEQLREINQTETGVATRIKSWQQARITTRLFRRMTFTATGLLLLNLLFFYVDPQVPGRALALWQTFERPNPYAFTVTPGDATIEQGRRFVAEVEFEGERPEQVAMMLRTNVEERYRSIPMEQTTGGRFVSAPQEIYESSQYRIRMGEFRSETFRLDVSRTPRLRELVARVSPPSYTGLEEKRYTYPFSRIEVPEGAEITLEASANKILESAELRFRSQDEVYRMDVNSDSTFSHSFTAEAPDTLRFQLRDDQGLQNRNEYNFSLRTIEDQRPTVRIVAPEASLQQLNPESLDLRIEARDDYGFSSVSVYYEIKDRFSPEVKSGNFRISGTAPASANLDYEWDLRELQLQAGDVLTYWIRAVDNDAYNGFKYAESARHELRAASLAESLIDQQEQESDMDRRLEELSRQQEDSRRQVDELRESIIENPDGSWEQREQVDEMVEQREQMNEQLQQIQQEFEQLRQEMDEDSGLSEETLRKYEELQQLMDEIDDPALMELLEELQKGMQDMNQQQLQEMMENMEFNEQSYQERLERTVELFKQLKLEADLDRMSSMLDELARQEEQVMQQQEDSEAQARQQESIQEELDKLREQMEQLPANSPARQQEQMQELSEQMQQQMEELQERLQENIDGLESGESEPGESQQQQQEIQQQLQQMSQQMAQAKSSMQQDQININIATLKTLFQNMLSLSEAQEEQNRSTLQLDNNSPAFVQQARNQRNISSGFSQIADSLFKVAKEIPQFTNAAMEQRRVVERTLGQSLDYLRERNRNQATTAERQALAGLNDISGMIANLIEQLENMEGQGGGGGGMSMEQMMQQMEQTGEQQQQLNQSIQEFINDMAGDRLSQDQIERLEQMSRQQNEIRRQMEEMQQRGAFEPGDRIMSDMERILEEMEESINDLRGGNTGSAMVERQQNIMSRMLETREAMDKRGQSEERKGQTAEEVEREEQPEMTLEELEREIRRRLQDPDQTNFTEDYQRLIRMYFEILREVEGQEVESGVL